MNYICTIIRTRPIYSVDGSNRVRYTREMTHFKCDSKAEAYHMVEGIRFLSVKDVDADVTIQVFDINGKSVFLSDTTVTLIADAVVGYDRDQLAV